MRRLRCNLFFLWLVLKYSPAIACLLPKIKPDEAQRDLKKYEQLYDAI
jgi:hypothetical protein